MTIGGRPEVHDGRDPAMKRPRIAIASKVTGALLVVITLLVILNEWGGLPWLTAVAIPLIMPVLILLLGARVRPMRRVFILVALVLTAAGALSLPGWWDTVQRALQTSAFIAAFFAALATLRAAAETSPTIAECGGLRWSTCSV